MLSTLCDEFTLKDWADVLTNPDIMKLSCSINRPNASASVNKFHFFINRTKYSVLDFTLSIQHKFWQEYLNDNKSGLNLSNDDNLVEYFNKLFIDFRPISPKLFFNNLISFKENLKHSREKKAFSLALCFTVNKLVDTKWSKDFTIQDRLLNYLLYGNFLSLQEDWIIVKNYLTSEYGKTIYSAVMAKKESEHLLENSTNKLSKKINLF